MNEEGISCFQECSLENLIDIGILSIYKFAILFRFTWFCSLGYDYYYIVDFYAFVSCEI